MRSPRRLRIPLLLAALLAAPIGCGGGGTKGPTLPGGDDPLAATTALRADHTTVDAAAIPLAALDQARALRMQFRHASVGANIWSGLGALATESAARYAHPAWAETNRGNPGWAAKITDLTDYVAVPANAAAYDVFQMKFCYIDQAADFATYRDAMLALEAAHPGKTFIWWTIPLTTSGTENALRATFNAQVRAYCAAHERPLFDIADIESHVGTTAVESGGNEALAAAWSSDGGHLNAAGSKRVASAMWWLMARIAGWNGP